MERYPSVLFNAWQADAASDPMLAFVRQLDEQLPRSLESEASRLMDLGAKIFRTGVGRTAELITRRLMRAEDLSSSTALDDIASTRLETHEYETKAVLEFRQHLEERAGLLAGSEDLNGPLVVFVDELDRCRPSFAVELLERIKHLFDVTGIVFVLGINQDELAHSVCAVYGSGFGGRKYLGRLIDLTYTLPEPGLDRFVKSHTGGWDQTVCAPALSLDQFTSGIAELLAGLGSSLRDTQQVLAELTVLLTVAPEIVRTCLAPALALLVALRRHHHTQFDDFVRADS